jgi:hypothetical protein
VTDDHKMRLLALVGALARAQPINRTVNELKALVDEIVAAPVAKAPPARPKQTVTGRKRPRVR